MIFMSQMGLIFCILGNFFKPLLSSVDFFQIQCFQKILSGVTIRVSNCLGPDQNLHFEGPDLGPNGLLWLSMDDIFR